MRTPINQRMIERAVRASCKAGMPPSSVECYPDGRIVLWFGGTQVTAEDGLDREMDQWRRKNAAN